MCERWGHEQDIEERNANRTDIRMNEQANERTNEATIERTNECLICKCVCAYARECVNVCVMLSVHSQ